jgi:hypothetical protein
MPVGAGADGGAIALGAFVVTGALGGGEPHAINIERATVHGTRVTATSSARWS